MTKESPPREKKTVSRESKYAQLTAAEKRSLLEELIDYEEELVFKYSGKTLESGLGGEITTAQSTGLIMEAISDMSSHFLHRLGIDRSEYHKIRSEYLSTLRSR